MRALHVIAKGEERIAAQRHILQALEPFALFLCGERLRPHREILLPHIVAQHVFPLLGNVDVDGVIAVRPAHTLAELERHDLGMLPQIPAIGLIARQARAVDARLLARAHADGLAAQRIAHGIRLRVFERNQRDQQIAHGAVGNLFVGRGPVFQHGGLQLDVVVPLLEGDAIAHLALQRSGPVSGIDLHHVVSALALVFEDFQRFRFVAGRDDPIRYLAGDQLGRGHIAGVAQGDVIAEGGHAVRAARARIRAGERRKRVALWHKIDLAQRFIQFHADRRARGAHVLERGGGGQARGRFQLAHELVAVERVQKIDIPRPARKHLHRQFALFHKDAGRLLVGIAAVFQREFLHRAAASFRLLKMRVSPPTRTNSATLLSASSASQMP